MEATLCASTYGPFCKTISYAATPKLIFYYDSSRGRLAGRLFDVHFACSLAVCVRSRAFLSCDSSSLRPGLMDHARAAGGGGGAGRGGGGGAGGEGRHA